MRIHIGCRISCAGRHVCLAGALIVAILHAPAVMSQDAPPRPRASALSPLDYLEIRQLVARYAYAVDTGADGGAVYASLFAPDGAFVDRAGREIRGREALAELARRNTRGAQSAFHFIVNHVIEPSPEGATGRQYLLQLRIGETGRPNDVFGGGTYEDTYVKTADGWRFTRRRYVPSEGTPASLQRRPRN